jgi:hypothetical protein
MWDARLQAYGAAMQFIAGRMMPLVITVMLSLLTAGTFTGVAKAVSLLSGQISNESNTTPTEVIDAFLTAQRVDDTEAAAAVFENDASIADTSGRTAIGADAVRRLIESLNGWEAGPRQAHGSEVIWPESLPIWRLPDQPTELDLRLEQEVPHYASTRWMCAIVTDGKIRAVTALAEGSPRSCQTELP